MFLYRRCFYIADSNGSLYPDRVESLVRMLRANTSLPLGFHAHDNLRLAFANALTALRNGVEWLDASLGGAGKGGGNLMAELAAGHIALRDGRPLDIFAMARAFAKYVAPTLENGPANYLPGLLYGLLDLNLDRIAEVNAECERRQMSLEDLLAVLYYQTVDHRVGNEIGSGRERPGAGNLRIIQTS
jgi:4-hydroxy 2-oxovalerate aldolase